jgi:hypothetical protein
MRAEERKHLEDACEELSPADTSRRRGALTRVGVEAAGAYLWIRRLRLGCRNLYGGTGIIRTCIIRRGSAHRSNAGPESGIGREYTMIAMAMDAGRGYEPGNTL